jgi:replicative DNA helicase
MTDFLSRIPPHSKEAEVAVLGGILLRNEAVDDVADVLTPEDFYEERHALIYDAMLGLDSRRTPIDQITLSETLRERGELDAVGGLAYLSSIMDRVPTAANIEAYARVIREKSSVRACLGAALTILEGGYGDYGDAGTFIAGAEGAILEATADRRERDVICMDALMRETVGWLDGLVAAGVQTFGIPVGIRRVDAMLGGLQPGGYYLIAGATSHGKTALAMQIAAAAGVPVYFASMEMSRRQLALRMLAQRTGISVHRLLRPSYWPSDGTGQILAAADRIAKLPIYIDDRAGSTPAKIAAKTRRLIRRHGIGLGIVDYVQIGQPSKAVKGQSREREVASMSSDYKTLARNADIPIIALSQLNRQGSKKDERPELSHLRDSGSLEQDADSVIFVWRPEKGQHKSTDREPAQIIVAKNRITGPIGTAMVDFIPARTEFVNREGDENGSDDEWWE